VELNWIEILIKVVLGFFMLFTITQILGKTTIKQLTPFDFISAIVLSELLGNGIYEEKVHIAYIFFTIFTWGVLLVIMEKLLLKFKKLRGVLEGNPSIIIRDGQIDRYQLKKNRMNINQLLSVLRQSETFSIREVAFAILESNGSISILKKSKYQKVTLQDLQIPPQPTYLSTSLIIDGEVLEDNVIDLGFDLEWLEHQVRSKGYSKVDDVLYADWMRDDGIYIIPFRSKVN
jgi:uncharacterized membrane protein YcaP (DUF421 family)